MKTIMLVCAAGMSTSLLVSKMEKAAEEKNIEADIFAVSVPEIDSVLKNKNIDVLLLGPQVRYMKSEIEEKVNEMNIPVDSIDIRHYGMMDGESVLEQALKLIDSNR